MSSEDLDGDFALVLRAAQELSAARATDIPIVREMIESSLALAKERAITPTNLDALIGDALKILQLGKGMTPENIRAFGLFRQAAVEGNREGQYWTGVMYGRGDGVEKDTSQSFKWLLLAAKQGNTSA